MKAPAMPTHPARAAKVERKTTETTITVDVNLDGSGKAAVETGVPFLDHMLDQVARHSLIDLDIRAKGDLHIDSLRGDNAHHQAETVFKAFARALRVACERDSRATDIVPSTKGAL